MVGIASFVEQIGSCHSITKPIVFVARGDGKKYILKSPYLPNPDHTKFEHLDSMFFHELLVQQIAEYLSIRTPIGKVLKLAQDDREKLPIKEHVKFPDGLYFISEFIEDTDNNVCEERANGRVTLKMPWFQFFSDIENISDMAKIIAMDIFTANFDRFRNPGNLLVSVTNKKRIVYAIDHGFAFWGHVWTKSRAATMLLADASATYIDIFIKRLAKTNTDQQFTGLGEIFRAMSQHVFLTGKQDDLASPLERIANITESMIDEWLHRIPEAWFCVKEEQIAVYKRFLLMQRQTVSIILHEIANRGAFSHYSGQFITNRNEMH